MALAVSRTGTRVSLATAIREAALSWGYEAVVVPDPDGFGRLMYRLRGLGTWEWVTDPLPPGEMAARLGIPLEGACTGLGDV